MRTNEEIYAQSKTANIPEIMAEAQREALEAYHAEILEKQQRFFDIFGDQYQAVKIKQVDSIDINQFINGWKSESRIFS